MEGENRFYGNGNQEGNNSSEINGPSKPTISSWVLTGLASTSSKFLREVNNEIKYQTSFNNSIKKPGVPREPFSPLKAPKPLSFIKKYGGVGFALWGASDIESQYRNDEINNFQRWTEQGSNALGAVPYFGTAWSIGWEGGRLITHIPGYHDNVRVPGTIFIDAMIMSTPIYIYKNSSRKSNKVECIICPNVK